MIDASVIKLEIVGGYQGGTEPWERTATIRIDSAGFHETHLVGHSGERAPLDVSQVASSLISEFEPASLLQLLEHVVELRAKLAGYASA